MWSLSYHRIGNTRSRSGKHSHMQQTQWQLNSFDDHSFWTSTWHTTITSFQCGICFHHCRCWFLVWFDVSPFLVKFPRKIAHNCNCNGSPVKKVTKRETTLTMLRVVSVCCWRDICNYILLHGGVFHIVFFDDGFNVFSLCILYLEDENTATLCET